MTTTGQRWDDNPIVVVAIFRPVLCNIDAMGAQP